VNRLVRTELLKQRTTRTFVAGVLAAPVVGALVALAIVQAAGTQGNEPLGPGHLAQALGAPADIVTVVALVIGVLGMAGEYRHQTITTTFLACPRRRDVVAAKLLAHALTGAAMAVLSLAAGLAVAVPLMLGHHVTPAVDGELLRVVAGLVAGTALYGALGVSVGALLRNQTTAITAVLVWILAVEGIVGDVFHRSAFVHWLPVAAGRALVHQGSSALSVPLAAATFSAYVAVLALAGARLTIGRDIT
jgi:ABC-2 type transport system permease protein